jgi:hypothetical protein
LTSFATRVLPPSKTELLWRDLGIRQRVREVKRRRRLLVRSGSRSRPSLPKKTTLFSSRIVA